MLAKSSAKDSFRESEKARPLNPPYRDTNKVPRIRSDRRHIRISLVTSGEQPLPAVSARFIYIDPMTDYNIRPRWRKISAYRASGSAPRANCRGRSIESFDECKVNTIGSSPSVEEAYLRATKIFRRRRARRGRATRRDRGRRGGRNEDPSASSSGDQIRFDFPAIARARCISWKEGRPR